MHLCCPWKKEMVERKKWRETYPKFSSSHGYDTFPWRVKARRDSFQREGIRKVTVARVTWKFLAENSRRVKRGGRVVAPNAETGLLFSLRDAARSSTFCTVCPSKLCSVHFRRVSVQGTLSISRETILFFLRPHPGTPLYFTDVNLKKWSPSAHGQRLLLNIHHLFITRSREFYSVPFRASYIYVLWKLWQH